MYMLSSTSFKCWWLLVMGDGELWWFWDKFCGVFTSNDCVFVRVQSRNIVVEETFGSEGSQFSSGCNNSPLHETITNAIQKLFFW